MCHWLLESEGLEGAMRLGVKVMRRGEGCDTDCWILKAWKV